MAEQQLIFVDGVLGLEQKLGIIGAGKVGASLGWTLKEKGYALSGIYNRTGTSAQRAARFLNTTSYNSPLEVALNSSLVIISTPDRAIEEVCQEVASQGGFYRGQIVFHTSGAHSSHILHRAAEKGASTMSLHPLQTFPSVEAGVQNIPASYFTMEGEETALEVGRKLVKDMGGLPLTIATEMKEVYHAAACVVCNYFVTLVDVGLDMMEASGISRSDALKAVMPLVEGTLSNIKKIGVPAALTGPIDRGDSLTVASHVQKMRQKMPRALSLYQKLGEHTAAVAEKKGTLTREEVSDIIKVLYDSN